jgi:hypothetical protein
LNKEQEKQKSKSLPYKNGGKKRITCTNCGHQYIDQQFLNGVKEYCKDSVNLLLSGKNKNKMNSKPPINYNDAEDLKDENEP